MLCRKCSAILEPEDKFCHICGEVVNSLQENIVDAEPEIIDIESTMNIGQPIIGEVPQSTINSIVEEKPQLVDEYQEQNNCSQLPPQVNTVNNEYVYENKETKKSNIKWLLPIIIIVLLVGIIGFIFYISRSPKVLFNSFINKAYKELNNNIVNDINSISGTISLQPNISTKDETNEIFEILNNVYINAEYEIDYEKKEALVKLDTQYEKEDLLDLDVYFEDEKGYVLIKDVYDKYLSTDVDGFDDMFEKVEFTDDHRIVIEEAKKSITKSLKSEYFEKETTEIKVGGETISVAKNSLVIDRETAKQLEIDVLTYLKDNDKFVSSLSNVEKESENYIIDSIDDRLKELEDKDISGDDEIIISIYTKGLMNEIVKLEVEMDVEESEISLSLTEESKNNYSINIISGEITYIGSVKILDNNSDNSTVQFSLTEKESGSTIGFSVGMSVKYNTELTNVDISDSQSADSLTEEESNEIMVKLMEREGIVNLITNLQEIVNSNSNYDDYYEGITCGDGVECYYGDEIIY